LLELVQALDRRELSTEERVRLLRLLVRPLTSRRSAHPIPELVDPVTADPDGADGLDPILALHSTIDHAGAEDVVRSRLSRLIPSCARPRSCSTTCSWCRAPTRPSGGPGGGTSRARGRTWKHAVFVADESF